MKKITYFITILLVCSISWGQLNVGNISVFLNDETNPLTGNDTVMHGTPLRLEVEATASSGKDVERVEFYRYGQFIGEGVLGNNGKWSLLTTATAHVFSISDQPSSTLLSFDVNNGSFEDWENGMPVGWWRGAASYHTKLLPVEQVTSTSHTGSSSVKIIGVPDYNSPDGNYTMNNWNNVWFANTIGMVIGSAYKISFYAKRVNGSVDDRLEVGTGYGKRFTGDLKYTRSDGDWQHYELVGIPQLPPLGSSDRIIFTSRKNGTAWVIDTVEVTLLEDSQDIYQVRVIENTGTIAWSEFAGIKTTPFQAKINFQSETAEPKDDYLCDYGEVYQKQGHLEYGWNYENDSALKTHITENNLQSESISFVLENDSCGVWELGVPNGEYQVTIHLPPSDVLTSGSRHYSLSTEDQWVLTGEQTSEVTSVAGRVVVTDGRLTLTSRLDSDENRIAAIEVAQLSADGQKSVFRRGIHPENSYKTTVVALDGQAGLRSIDLSSLDEDGSKPMHYSHSADDHVIDAFEPVVHFGSWRGSSDLLTDVTYDFGVSAGNLFQPLSGLFKEDVLKGQSPSSVSALEKFYLTVFDRDKGTVVNRLPLDIPDPGTQEWNALIEDGMRKKFVHAEYGLTTWIKIEYGNEWNYPGVQEISNYSYTFTHMADANSVDYAFVIEAASTFGSIPAVQFTEGDHAGLATTNSVYSIAFDVGQPWRVQQFELSHGGETLPSQYQGTDVRALSMSENDLQRIVYRNLNATGTGAGTVLNFSSQAALDQFEEDFSGLDNAPEFKHHPILDEFVADYQNNPLALARYVFNEIEVTDFVGVHPGLTATDIPVEVTLGGLRRDALAVLQEGQGSPREICILLAYLLRASGVPAAIAEPSGANVYILDTDYSNLIGQRIAGTELTPEKIPVEYPWVVAYIEGDDQPIKHLFPWIKETELSEGYDLYDLLPERLDNGYKYFEKFIRADDEVMVIGADGEVDASVRSYDDDQPYILWPALMKRLCAEQGVSFDEVGIRKINRPQQYARWQDFPRPFEVLGQPTLYPDYAHQPSCYDTVKFHIVKDDLVDQLVDMNTIYFETGEIPIMDLHNRPINIDYSNGKIILTIAPFLPYTGSITYSTDTYPDIATDDYVSRAKLGYQYNVSLSNNTLDFACLEHRQRSFTQTIQNQDTRSINYAGNSNFWNNRRVASASGIRDAWEQRSRRGILFLVHDQLKKGNYSYCYNFGRVTKAMQERHRRDLAMVDVTNPDTISDVKRSRLFALMGQAYWRTVNDFSHFSAQKHKLVLPHTGGVLRTGMLQNGNGQFVHPFVDVSGYTLSSYRGGHINQYHGHSSISSRIDFLHSSHIQASSYEHGILRNFLGAEGAYSTVKVLQQASLNHRADPQNVPDIVVLTNGPNKRGKNWEQEGNQYYQGKRLKDWGLWDKVKWHLDDSLNPLKTLVSNPSSDAYIAIGQQIDAFEIAYMPPGPVDVDGVKRHGVATTQFYGGSGYYISDSKTVLNGGGSKEVTNFFPTLSLGSDSTNDFYTNVVDGNFNFNDSFSRYSNTTGESYFVVDDDGSETLVLPNVVVTASTFNEPVFDYFSIEHETVDTVYSIYADLVDSTDTAEELVQKLQEAIEAYLDRRGIALSWMTEGGQLNGGVNKTSYNNGKDEQVGDPVNVLSGDFYIDTTDMTLAGPFPLNIRRNYSSTNTAENGMGIGWKFAFAHYLEVEEAGNDAEAVLYAAEMDGSVIGYRRESIGVDRWKVDVSLNPQLKNSTEEGSGSLANLYNNYIIKSGSTYTLYAVNGEKRVYERRAYPWEDLLQRDRPYLKTWFDAHGNGFTFTYYENPIDYGYGNIKRIDSTNGSSLNVKYNSNGQISEIFSKDGRRIQYNYNNYGDLTQVTLPDRSTINYAYHLTKDDVGEDISTHLISSVEEPLGRILENDYDANRRVIRQGSTVGQDGALVQIADYDYTHTQQAGDSVSGHTLVTAVNNGVTRYDYTNGQITAIADAENNLIEQAWYVDRLTFPNPSAAPDSQRMIPETTVASLSDNALGGFPRSLKWLKDKRGRVIYFWYDAFGNIVQTKTIGEIDGDLSNGDEVAVTRTKYNAKQLPIRSVNPIGNITRIEYNDSDYPYLPTALESRDSGDLLISRIERVYTEIETPSASAYGLSSEVREAIHTEDESYTLTEYSSGGFPIRMTQYTDEDDLNNISSDPNVVTEFVYDGRGLLIEQVDLSGTKIAYQYDSMDRLIATSVYDSVGELLSSQFNHYNAAGDLEWVDGPRTGVEDYTYMRYDKAGRLKQQLVWRSQAASDGTGVESISQSKDEAFSVSQFFYDGFGNLTSIISPNGHEKRMEYDKIGRKLSEDSYNGAYSEESVPLSSLSWTYEPGGQVHTETNTLGGTTNYFYTDAGAVRFQQNPDDTITQNRYLLDGRLAKTILPSGNEIHYVYDDLARTVTTLLTKDTGEQLSQTVNYYDRRGNLIRTIDAENYEHTIAYDDLNRVVLREGPLRDGVGTEQQLSSTAYDPINRSTTITDASEQTVTTILDALGRTKSVITRDAQDTVVRETYFDYSADHHSVTRTEGSNDDAIRVTTWSNTQGQPVLQQYHLDTGGYNYERNVYDFSGNPILAVDALGYATESEYDGLNRLISTTLPDGAKTKFRYKDQGKVVERVMPGGLMHESHYDIAGRLISEANSNPDRPDTDGTILQQRRFTYEYYSTGREIGQLKFKRHLDEGIDEIYTYDDYLRLKNRTIEGNSDLYSVELEYSYDKRGLVTGVGQSIGGEGIGIPDITVNRSFDAYGQIRTEQVTEESILLSSIAQTWNSEGLRSSIRSATTDSLSPVVTRFGGAYHYNFLYTAANRIATVAYGGSSTFPSSVGQPYEAYYLTNGLLDYANAYRLRYDHDYDARGRLTNRILTNLTNGATLLNEQTTWTKRRKMATYSNTRADRTWSEQKSFNYNPRGQLKDEAFNAATNTATEARYNYDLDRLGILTGRHVSGGVVENWSALELDTHARLNEMTESYLSTADGSSYTATGTAGFGQGLRAWHNGEPIELDIQEDSFGKQFNWSTDLVLSPGPQLLELRLADPNSDEREPFDLVEKRYFTVKSESIPDVQIEHDLTGRIVRSVHADGSYRNFTWDALGRLWKIESRDASGDGYNWSAWYDGLGRRLRVDYKPVIAEVAQPSQAKTVYSVYDPEVEFMEIGVKVDGEPTQWKVYGNDLNGIYGSLQGLGGLIAIHGDNPAAGMQSVDDVFGHQIALVDIGDNTVDWLNRDYSAYGQLGDLPQALEAGGDLSLSCAWRSYRTDVTGLIWMGARYYDAKAGRFLSPDPLGHSASMDLYSFANGDPINFIDPTGRNAYFTYDEASGEVQRIGEYDGTWSSFVGIMSEFPSAVYNGVFKGIPRQVMLAGKEIKSEAYSEITFSSDPFSGYLSGIKYYAGSVFQFGGMASGTVLGLPENTVDLTNHSLASVGFYGETAQELAIDTTLLTIAEALFVAQNGLGFVWDNRGEIAHSFVSGDPFNYSVGLTYQSDNTLALGFVSGKSEAASTIIDAVGFGTGHLSYRRFGGAIHGGNPGPLSGALALSGPFALVNGWLGANRDLLSELNGNGFDLNISYNNGFGFSLTYQNVAEISVDPVSGNNPTLCP